MTNLGKFKKKFKYYKCPWPMCGEQFKAHEPAYCGEGKKLVATKVSCPACKNGIKN